MDYGNEALRYRKREKNALVHVTTVRVFCAALQAVNFRLPINVIVG